MFLKKIRERSVEVFIGIIVTALLTGVGYSLRISHQNCIHISYLSKSHDEIKTVLNKNLRESNNKMDDELKVIKRCLVDLMVKLKIDTEEIKKLINHEETIESNNNIIEKLDKLLKKRDSVIICL